LSAQTPNNTHALSLYIVLIDRILTLTEVNSSTYSANSDIPSESSLTVAHDGTSSSSTTTEQLPSNTPLVTPAAVAALHGAGNLAAATGSSDDTNASERDLREERLQQQQQQRSSSGSSGSRGSLNTVPEQSEAVREDVHAGLDYGLKHGGSPTEG
jgi:hypothetical protein